MNTQDILRLAAARTYAANGTAREIRERHHLTLADVARAVGVDRPRLSRWERNERRPCGPAAIRWVNLLDDLERRKTSVAA